jgi:Asp-tRNA(Asn)/Glu-tRNA(Gln) amidotransferase A subunit family amidase
MYSDPAFAPAARLAEQLRDGTLTARRLTELYLERIDRLNPGLRAYRTVRREAALAEADAADERLTTGHDAPLLGLPIAVKDNLAVAGELTTHGTSLVHEPARADCEAVRRLRAAGAVILGITNMPELALWGHDTSSPTYGATRNPHDAQRSPGGSSGGSAVAVARATRRRSWRWPPARALAQVTIATTPRRYFSAPRSKPGATANASSSGSTSLVSARSNSRQPGRSPEDDSPATW